MTAIFNHPALAVAALILGFGFLIFVHELGHFAVAKWVGIRCTQFAIGFGTAMGSWRRGIGFRAGGTEGEYTRRAVAALEDDGESLEGLSDHARNRRIMEKADEMGMGETEYRLNWLPLGGYVKMLGQEDMDPNAQSDDPRAFNRKPVWARAAVISAGVIMNLIFGLIFFIICFQLGVEFPAAQVGGVVPGSPAAAAYARGHDGDGAYLGLQTGDRITHINGNRAQDMADVKIATALGKGGDSVEVTVERDGEPGPLTYDITPVPSPNDRLLYIGVEQPSTLTIGETLEGKATASEVYRRAGVEPGMTLTAVNGQAVDDTGDVKRLIAAADRPGLTLTFTAADGEDTVTVESEASPRLEPEFGEGGVLLKEMGSLFGLRAAMSLTPLDGSPAAEAGVEPGDVLARIGEADWPTYKQLQETLADAPSGGVDLRVWRGGEGDGGGGAVVDLGKVTPDGGKLGVGVNPAVETNHIAGVVSDSPLAEATRGNPLPPGSRVTGLNGSGVGDFAELRYALHEAAAGRDANEPLELAFTFEVNLAGQPVETYTVTLDPQAASVLAAAPRWEVPAGLGFEPLLTTLKADSAWGATKIGLEKSKQFIQQTYITLLRLAQGTVKPSHLRGPVGIVDEGSKFAQQGIAYFLFFLGIISVNLAVINFLPIPIVDGGLMVFLLIEKIKGSPASPKVQTAALLAGLVLIACVFLFVTYHDIARLVTG